MMRRLQMGEWIGNYAAVAPAFVRRDSDHRFGNHRGSHLPGAPTEGYSARPAAALRSAQLEMEQQTRWRFPYHWAAFELQGEWK